MIEKIFKAIYDTFASQVEIETEPPEFRHYPFETARKKHNEAIRTILKNPVSVLAMQTGYGKTAVYLTAIAESGLEYGLVIVPRNWLQVQVAEYSDRVRVPILYLFERSKHCNKIENDRAPCRKKYLKNNRWVFKYKGKEMQYPCPDCPYDRKKEEIASNYEGITVLNQGNFWFMRNKTQFVVIDEADETIRSITDKVSFPEKFESDDPVEVLEWMEDKVIGVMQDILKKLEEPTKDTDLETLNTLLHAYERKLRKIRFFMTYPPEKLITYTKGNSTFVEVFDSVVNVIMRLFGHAERICIVTATFDGNCDGQKIPVIDVDVPYRARVIYAPVGNLSERNVFRRKNTDLLEKAVDVILKTYDYTVSLTGMRKSPIHCGNLGKHGRYVYDLLTQNGRKAILMEKGSQAKAIAEFLRDNDVDFLCVVSAEYGFDWGFSPIQYILKVPFADLKDPRLKAIEKKLGREKFNEWYNWDALSRLIQACGRNARSPNDFGVTIILDSCFERLYRQFEDKIPKWFKDRLVWITSESQRGGDSGDNGA
jgi:hypothetical protein